MIKFVEFSLFNSNFSVMNNRNKQNSFETPVGTLKVEHLAHFSLYLEWNGVKIYVDPYSDLFDFSNMEKADVLLLTHAHGDHYDCRAIECIATPETEFVVSESVGWYLKGDFAKAEELINALPFSAIDKEEQLGILYQRQERYQDAEKIWEHRVIKGVAELQRDLINMLEIALQEKRDKDAEFLADLQESLNRQFYFPEWMCYNAHLQLALVKKDKDESLSILQKMLPSMKKEWKIQSSPLYRNADGNDSTWLSGRLAKTFADEIANNEEYAFLREGSELEELLAQLEDL